MNKNISFLLLISISFLSAQKSDCSTLQKEIDNAKTEISELSKQNFYYKETLNLLKPIKSATVDDVKFDITKVVGSKANKTISISFLYENRSSEIRNFLQCQEAYAIDPKGNQYQTYEVFVAPNKNIRIEKINPNVPAKGNFIFQSEDVDFPILRFLKIQIYPKDNISSPKDVIFENLPIIWE